MPGDYEYQHVDNAGIYKNTDGIGKKEPYRVAIDGYFLPITPSKISYTNGGRNETAFLVNDRAFTIPHTPEVQTFEFEFRVPAYVEYYNYDGRGNPSFPAYMNSYGEPHHQFWSDMLWEIMYQKKPCNLYLERHDQDTCMDRKVLLNEFSYEEDAEKGDDFIFHVTFMDYYEQHNQETSDAYNHHLIATKHARGWLT